MADSITRRPAGGEAVLKQLLACAAHVAALLAHRRLHLHHRATGQTVALPDGRTFVVYRDTTCDDEGTEPEVTLAVWFHLRGTRPETRWRSWLFERESILNTILYAGFPGYRRKLWMVDRATGDYAGLYAWCGHDAAQRYATYITAVLRPLATPGSLGYEIVDQPLAAHLGAAP